MPTLNNPPTPFELVASIISSNEPCSPSRRRSFFSNGRNRQNSNVSMPSTSVSGASRSAERKPAVTAVQHPFSTPTPSQSTRRPANLMEPPPAYEAAESYQAPAITIEDSKLAYLSIFDTIFLIDDSGSMAGGRWRETGAAIKAIAPICTQYDTDGIDLHFLNTPDSPAFSGLRTAEDVARVFATVRPQGMTPTGTRLNALLKPYLRRCEQQDAATGAITLKPINIIVITDGEACDEVDATIIAAATRLDQIKADAQQVGIQFFQVGQDKEATAALKALDDDLAAEGIRDMVDTVSWSSQSGTGLNAEGILKVVLGAVHRKYDKSDRKSIDIRPAREPGT